MDVSNLKRVAGFQVQASASIGAGATVDLLSGMSPLNMVPSNQFLRILGIATYTGSDLGAWGKLTWNVFQNGQPISPAIYNQSDQLGQQNQPLILGLPLLVYPGSVLTVPVANSDGVAHTGGILIIGEYLALN